jgi:tetratricopeptide (TPR) repeat protein/tRNA A-37 threonylcarbamoyl transferase component Bud32
MAGPDIHGDAIDQAVCKRFESAWRSGQPEPIEHFLPGEEQPNYLATLEELVRVELQLAWQSWARAAQQSATAPQDETIARPPNVEAYLARFPRLREPDIVLRLLSQERLARRQCGEEASLEEYRRRFPELPLSEEQSASALPMLSQSSQNMDVAETLATGQPGGPPAPGAAPQDFGNYESLEEIGRGGMGVVYRARQRTADRVVALKVIRRDRLEQLPRDTHSSALERFRHEAQAAAKLEHENIVTVYEVGEIDQQPFFSMRYVEGRSLAEILREGPMENRRAAAYLEPVARAVHEAHSRGILHRDLKPQNILVDKKTDRALVADFGLAKLSEGGEELTRAGEIMGTPSYMSPEQAKDSARVTAKTDVYALGATLYHMLTARPPFQAATPLETLRQVIDREPAPPRQLNPSIDRDLETVCLKCLQKEASRRYDSAHALAEDLRRYLDGEPILARPIGTLARIWRWCRRKPALATAIALAATFFVLAFVGTGVGYLRASAARAKAEARLQDALTAVDELFNEVSENTLLNQPGMQPVRRKLLTKASVYYQRFLDQHGDDPTLRDAAAMAHFRLGLINEMIDSPDSALAFYRRARDMQAQLVEERPGDRDCLQNLGNTWNAIAGALTKQTKLNEARNAHLEAIAIRRQLADEAPPNESEYARTLANSYMNLGRVEMNLASLQRSQEAVQRQFAKARREMEEAQRIRHDLLTRVGDSPKTRRDLGKGYFNLACLAMTKNQPGPAEKCLTDAIDIFRKLLDKDPQGLANQIDLATCRRVLGDLKSAVGRPDEARLRYQEALGGMDKLARENPAVPSYRSALAGLHMNLAQLEWEQGRSPAAQAAFQQARDLLQALVTDYADVPDYRRKLALTLREIGCLQSEDGQYETAAGNLKTAEDALAELIKQYPNNPEFDAERDVAAAASAVNSGRLQRRAGNAASARQSFQRALDILQMLMDTDPSAARYRRDRAVALREMALLKSDAGEYQAARQDLELARGYLDALVASFPGNLEFQGQLAKTKAALEVLPAASRGQGSGDRR